MDEIIIIALMFMAFAAFVFALMMLVEFPQRKVNDEPIYGMKCNLCGKRQSEARNTDWCVHVWTEAPDE